jgi:hypothetical protein
MADTMTWPAPGINHPHQTPPADLGDGHRARIEQLEHYTSTACHHDLHDRCRHTCKYCAKPCRCTCHHRGDQQ